MVSGRKAKRVYLFSKKDNWCLLGLGISYWLMVKWMERNVYYRVVSKSSIHIIKLKKIKKGIGFLLSFL